MDVMNGRRPEGRGGFHYHFSKPIIALPCSARGPESVLLKEIPRSAFFYLGVNSRSCAFLQIRKNSN
jgi:hypothetical protein